MENFSIWNERVWIVQYSAEHVFRLVLDKDKSGKFRLYFLEWKQGIPTDPSNVAGNNLPFITFSNHFEEWIRILGMYVPPVLRWTDFSDVMLSRFFQMVEQAYFPLWPTAQIKKPLLAAKLAKIGFIPERSDIIARIIWTDKQNIPVVVIEENKRWEGVVPKSISQTKKNTFYHVVSSADKQNWKRVAIQTRYLPPGSVAIREYIDKFSPAIEGKVRLYPAKVKKLLEEK